MESGLDARRGQSPLYTNFKLGALTPIFKLD